MQTMLIAQSMAPTQTVNEVVPPYIYVFYAAFVVTFLLTPAMRVVALYYGVIDRPDQGRKVHTVPIAYLGGVAVFIGWLTGLAVSQFLVLHHVEPGWPTTYPIVKFSIVFGAIIILMLGLWDDTHGVRPVVKIGGQVAAALFLLWDGIGLDAARPMLQAIVGRVVLIPGVAQAFQTGGVAKPMLPDWLIVAVSSVMVVGIIVICCNASNLMDGLDGLCGGVTGIIAAGFLFVAVHLATTGGGVNTNWDALRVILGLALLGAVLGFMPYNFNPASIFMGDTGSMLLGFVCGTMIILLAQQGAKWALAAMVIFALPILDTVLAFVRRWLKGRPIFEADKQHFHHQLVARGFTVKQTVLISYGLSMLFALLGAAMVFMRTRYTVAIYMVTFGYVIVAAYKMGMVHERPRIVRRPDLASATAGATLATIEAATVLEIDDNPRPAGSSGESSTAPPSPAASAGSHV